MVLSPERIQEIKEELASLSPEDQEKRVQEIIATLSPDELQQLQGGGGGEQECPFCLMAQGKIPVKTVYEDVNVIAILDINPANKGHLLLFPKKHSQFFTQVEDKEVGHIFKVAKHLCSSFDVLGAKAYNVHVSNGVAAGQRAPHFLVNLIPRFDKDGVQFGWSPKKSSDSETEEILNKLKAEAKKVNIKEEVEVVVTQPAKKGRVLEVHRVP